MMNCNKTQSFEWHLLWFLIYKSEGLKIHVDIRTSTYLFWMLVRKVCICMGLTLSNSWKSIFYIDLIRTSCYKAVLNPRQDFVTWGIKVRAKDYMLKTMIQELQIYIWNIV